MDINIKKTVSENISKFRKQINMSQKEFASKLGVTPSRVSNWEAGTNMMDVDMLFRICDVLGVSINDMYGVYPDADIRLSFDEQSVIKKYRDLDEHGKHMVDVVLLEEHQRCLLEKDIRMCKEKYGENRALSKDA